MSTRFFDTFTRLSLLLYFDRDLHVFASLSPSLQVNAPRHPRGLFDPAHTHGSEGHAHAPWVPNTANPIASLTAGAHPLSGGNGQMQMLGSQHPGPAPLVSDPANAARATAHVPGNDRDRAAGAGVEALSVPERDRASQLHAAHTHVSAAGGGRAVDSEAGRERAKPAGPAAAWAWGPSSTGAHVSAPTATLPASGPRLVWGNPAQGAGGAWGAPIAGMMMPGQIYIFN